MTERRNRIKNFRKLAFVVLLSTVFLPHIALGEKERCNKAVYRIAGEISGLMHLPSDVAFGSVGKVYVLDGTADLVRIYDKSGKQVSTLGGGNALKLPLGLDVNEHGDVLVADSGNHRLALFRGGTDKPEYVDVPSPDGGKPADPTDVHFSRTGNALVVDNDNHRIMELTMSGDLLWARGSMGRNEGEFRFPFMLDADQFGNLFIVEVINTRVQTLTPRGEYRNFIGEWGIEPGQFYRPKGVAVSNSGEVFVSDSYLGIIQIFDKDGRFLGVVGNDHGNIRRFKTPVGMDAAEGLLAVVEMVNNRVLILEKKQ